MVDTIEEKKKIQIASSLVTKAEKFANTRRIQAIQYAGKQGAVNPEVLQQITMRKKKASFKKSLKRAN